MVINPASVLTVALLLAAPCAASAQSVAPGAPVPGPRAPAAAPGGPGAAPAPPPVSDDASKREEQARRIQDLIRLLDNPDAGTRDAAAKSLIEIGPPAVPPLEAHLRGRGVWDVVRLLRRIEGMDEADGPFRFVEREKRLPSLEEADRMARTAAAQPDRYVEAKYYEAVRLYRRQDYERALAIVQALMGLEPQTPHKARLRELKMICDHQVMQHKIVAASVVPPAKDPRIGEDIEFTLRIQNVSPSEVRLAFGPAGDGAVPAGGSAQVIADVKARLVDPLGMTREVQRWPDWSVPAFIAIPPGGTWEQKATVATKEDDAVLDPTYLRIYTVGIRLFPGRLWVGEHAEARRIEFEAGEARAFPARATWRAADPLSNLSLVLDDPKATIDELFLAAMRVPPKDAEAGAKVLVQALPRFGGPVRETLMTALGELTGQPFGKDVQRWLDWGGVKVEKPKAGPPVFKDEPEGGRERRPGDPGTAPAPAAAPGPPTGPAAPGAGTAERGPLLFRALNSDRPDAVRAAVTYLGRQGGPAAPDPPPESAAAWRAAGRKSLDWLVERPPEELGALVEGYPEFERTWDPAAGSRPRGR